MIGYFERERTSSNANNHELHARVSLFPAIDRVNVTPNPPVPGLDTRSIDPRMFRITLAGTTGGLAMGHLQADGIFIFDDDLSYERSDKDRSLPATQLYDNIGGTTANPIAKRLSEGHLSWMATLVPKVQYTRRFISSNPSVNPPVRGIKVESSSVLITEALPSDEYVLSVVVFHDRQFDPRPVQRRLHRRSQRADGAGNHPGRWFDRRRDSAASTPAPMRRL